MGVTKGRILDRPLTDEERELLVQAIFREDPPPPSKEECVVAVEAAGLDGADAARRYDWATSVGYPPLSVYDLVMILAGERDAMTVECPECGVAAGVDCVDPERKSPHSARVRRGQESR